MYPGKPWRLKGDFFSFLIGISSDFSFFHDQFLQALLLFVVSSRLSSTAAFLVRPLQEVRVEAAGVDDELGHRLQGTTGSPREGSCVEGVWRG